MKLGWYAVFAAVVLSMLGWAEYRGWRWTDVTEIRNVPRSIRDNPGAYRALYRTSPRDVGGK